MRNSQSFFWVIKFWAVCYAAIGDEHRSPSDIQAETCRVGRWVHELEAQENLERLIWQFQAWVTLKS